MLDRASLSRYLRSIMTLQSNIKGTMATTTKSVALMSMLFWSVPGNTIVPQPQDIYQNDGSVCGQTVSLPEPTGPHQVGTSLLHFVDFDRPEAATANPNDRRQIVFQLLYPAIRTKDVDPVAYVPELEAIRTAIGSDSREVAQKVSKDLERYGCVLTHAFAEMPVSDLASKYPVLLFSPGGNMSRHWHTSQAQEFASRGFIVVLLSHAYSTLDFIPGAPVMAPERWQVPENATPEQATAMDDAMSEELALDARFALTQIEKIASGAIKHPLNGHIDLARVAIAGHSRGGKTVARACSTDPRFKACITYDNVAPEREQASGLKIPQLTVRTRWAAPRKETLRSYLMKNSIYAADVEIAGATHFNFSDLQIVDPGNYEYKLDPVKGLNLANEITLSFLDDVFRGRSPQLRRFAKAAEVEVWTTDGR